MQITKELIGRVDSEGMWQELCNFPRHWREAMEFSKDRDWHVDPDKVDNICIVGMGGSAIGADLLISYISASCPIPVKLIRHGELPGWVDENSLFIACSYSGNTEETLAALQKADERGAQLFAITTGGKLLVRASSDGFGYSRIPGGRPPRAALGHLFVPLFYLFHHLGLLPEDVNVLDETAMLLQEQVEVLSNLQDSPALVIAEDLQETLPLVYSNSSLMSAVNLRWRSQFEENAKMLSYGNLFPEMCHNEIVGWEQITHLTGRLSVIFLEDKEDSREIKQMMDVVYDLIEDQAMYITRLKSTGNSRLSRQFSQVQFGDWVSLYLALLSEVDPTPIAKIELLKSRLAEL